MHNIATITNSANSADNRTYTYNGMDEMLTEKIGSTTYTYTYDSFGNIYSASDGTTTHTYTYGNTEWRDLLTAYDGQSITYDGIGNPLSYYNGTRWTFSWINGRRLASASDGTTNISYTYDMNGIRSSKTVGGVTYNFITQNGKVVRQTWGSNVLDISYDVNGKPFCFVYNGTEYYYVLNLQGDVIRIINTSGATVAEYRYDAWGNLLTAESSLSDIGKVNPIRYRGYYYDTETGFYYVSSRYYDPEIGRFINSDVLVSTGQGFLGYNMFAYCRNNPVRRIDTTGYSDIDVEEISENGVDDRPEEFGGGGGGSSGGNGGTIPVNTGGTPGGSSIPAVAGPGGNCPTHIISNGPTYPQNPNDFNPKGLEKHEYVAPGTGKNGGIIKWEIPGNRTAIFEWDEDYKKGSHYHAMRIEWGSAHMGDHIWPDSLIEEPWRSEYF